MNTSPEADGQGSSSSRSALLAQFEEGLASARREIAEFDPTKIALLDAAERCFTQSGHFHTTVDDICKEAGVQKRVFYRHFRNKSDVINNYFRLQRNAHLELARALISQASDEVDPVDHLLRSFVILFDDRRRSGIDFDRGRRNIEWWAEGTRNIDVLMCFEETFDYWRRLVQEMIEEALGAKVATEEARDVAMVLVMALNGLMLHSTVEREVINFDSLADYWSAAWRGLRQQLVSRSAMPRARGDPR